MEVLGADPTRAHPAAAHPLPAQLAREGAEGTGHPVHPRRHRPGARRPAVGLPRRARACAPGPAPPWSTRTAARSCSGSPSCSGPTTCCARWTPSARRASASAPTSTRCSRSRRWPCDLRLPALTGAAIEHPRHERRTRSDLPGRRSGRAATGEHCRFVTFPRGRSARLSCAHEPSPRRRPRGCHGRRPRALRVLGHRRHPRLGPRARRSRSRRRARPRVRGALARSTPSGSTGPTARERSARPSRCPSTTTTPRATPSSWPWSRCRRRSGSKRIGSLVVNPGGPGGSGVDYARAADFIVGKGVRDAYDVVGFDPRGVGRSAPDRLRHRRRARRLPRFRPDARRRRGGAGLRGQPPGASRSPAARRPVRCSRHVSTRDAARDMDVLRAALGEQKLTYLGKSYGTYLGAIYADLFPETGRPDGARRRRRPRPHPGGAQPRPGEGLRARHPAVGGLLRRGGRLPAG